MGKYNKDNSDPNPEYVYGRKNPNYKPSAPAIENKRGPDLSLSQQAYINQISKEFVTGIPYNAENEALEALMDREPDEVPDFPHDSPSEIVLGEFARHAISSAYTREHRELPDDLKDDGELPDGSDGGKVISRDGDIIGYGLTNEDGKILSVVSLNGELVSFQEEDALD